MQFNINNYVHIKMTQHGRDIYEKYWTDLMSGYKDWQYNPKKESVDGWSKWQMWDVMRVFGEHMYNGCVMPFEANIIIEEKQ